MPSTSHFVLPAKNTPGWMLWQVGNLWQRKVGYIISEMDLTSVQFLLLSTIYRFEILNRKPTQNEVALNAGADKMMTSSVLRSLEKKGWVTRTVLENDNRAKVICLTTKGRVVILEAIEKVQELSKIFFSSIDKDALTNQLNKILTHNS